MSPLVAVFIQPDQDTSNLPVKIDNLALVQRYDLVGIDQLLIA